MDPIHLTTEEQDYELNIRGVFNLSTARQKTTWIREFLKKEMDGERTVSQSRVEQLNPISELSRCTSILEEIISVMETEGVNLSERLDCRSRLIHVIDRIKRAKPTSPEDQTAVYEILVEAENRLSQFPATVFSGVPSIQAPPVDSIHSSPLAGIIENIQSVRRSGIEKSNEVGSIDSLNNAEQVEDRQPRRSILNPTVRDFVPERAMDEDIADSRVRIPSLNQQQMQTWQQVEVNTQRVSTLPSLGVLEQINPEQNQSNNRRVNPFRLWQARTVESDGFRDEARYIRPTPQAGSVGPTRHSIPLASAGRENPAASIGRENPDFVLRREFPIIHTDRENPEEVSRRDFPFDRLNRKYVPVHQWRLAYSGDGQGIHLYDFLSELRMLQRAEGVSDAELLSSVVHLLTGRARLWYRSWFDTFHNWDGFVAAMKTEFLPPKYDYKLLSTISNRKQKQSETFAEYVSLMLSLFRHLSIAVEERHKLGIIEENMLPKYATATSVIEINSLEQLSNVCRRVDFAYSKEPFMPSLDCITEPRVASRQTFNRSRDVHELDMVQQNRGNAPRVFGGSRNSAQVSSGEVAPLNQNPSGFQAISQGGARDGLVSTIRGCFNCRQPGHSYNVCPVPRRGTFCYRCGTPNATTFSCRQCQRKNEEGGSGQRTNAPNPAP